MGSCIGTRCCEGLRLAEQKMRESRVTVQDLDRDTQLDRTRAQERETRRVQRQLRRQQQQAIRARLLGMHGRGRR